jgi:acetyl esterase
MALWPEELEGLREEARQMAGAISDMYSGGAAEPTGSVDRVTSARAMLSSLEQPSDDGVDEEVGGVPCRVFRPAGASQGTYLHFHGGAMIMGSPRMNDQANAALAKRLPVTVVSVDYRLAPEHPFPAGSDDCLAVASAVIEREQGPIVVGGESAGGYFAALVLLRIRDELGAIDRITAANLVYGVFDLSSTPSGQGIRPSEVKDVLGDGDDYVIHAYIPGMTRMDARRPDVSPMWAHLHDMPPALFTVGSADHLLDDSLFMSRRWEAYGNEAELAVYPDCIHGFNGFPMEMAKRANERIDTFLDKAFAG